MSESGFNSAGAFSGGKQVAKRWYRGCNESHGQPWNRKIICHHEATPEIVDAAAQDVLKMLTHLKKNINY